MNGLLALNDSIPPDSADRQSAISPLYNTSIHDMPNKMNNTLVHSRTIQGKCTKTTQLYTNDYSNYDPRQLVKAKTFA